MNFLPGRLEGGAVKTPIGDMPLPEKLRSRAQGDGDGARDVIVGIRPEHFEDAAVEPDEHAGPDEVPDQGRRGRVDGLRALRLLRRQGARRCTRPSSTSWPPTPAWRICPSHGDGQQVVARLSAESKAAPGGEVELSLDTSQIKLFAAEDGRSLSAAA